MTAAERKALCAYIRWVGDAMELRDWTFELLRDPAEDGCFAVVRPIFGQKLALISVCQNFRQLDRKKQREIVAHELIHCHLAALQSQLEDDLEEHLGKASYALFFESAKRNLEYAVNGLEMAIAKHLPLIKWPPSKGTA
jgi:hypothetical protein